MFSAYVTPDADDILVSVELADGHRSGEYIPGDSNDEDINAAIWRVRKRAIRTRPRVCACCGVKSTPPCCHACDALLPPITFPA